MGQGRTEIFSNLAQMLDAGLPLARTLPLAARGSRHPIARALPGVRERIEAGESLTGAMAAEGSVFRPIEIALVRVGESSGRLPETFRALASWHAFLGEIRKLLLSELIYPVLLLHLIPLIMNLPPAVLGQITIEQYLLRVGGFLAGFYLVALAVVVVAHLRRYVRVLAVGLDGALLALPVFGPAVRDLALSRFCRAFAAMIEAGMPVDETLRMSARASGNAVMQDRLLEGLAAVEDCRPPSEGFRRLPPDFLAVWQTGEETGGFSVAAARLAEERAERARFRFKLGATWFARGLYFLILLAGAYMVVRMGMDLVGKISELGVLP